ERRLPAAATVGTPALVGLIARNDKPKTPSFSLQVREKGGDVSGAAFLLVLDAQKTQEFAYWFTPSRRGRHRFERLEVATRAPFGLFEKARPVDSPAELVVFPRQVPPPDVDVRRLAREGDRTT